MKYLLSLIALFATLTAQGQCSEFDNLLQKGDNYLKGSKPNYQEAINAYTAAILACSDRAGKAKQRIAQMVSDINKLKESAVAAEKRAIEAQRNAEQNFKNAQLASEKAEQEQKKTKETLEKLQKANEDFVQRFLQNARADMCNGRVQDALGKIKTASAMGVLSKEVGMAYLANADSSIILLQFETALECAKNAFDFGVLNPLDFVKFCLKINAKSVLNLQYEIALESIKSAVAFDVLKDEVKKAYLEIAFWHGEIGNITRAATLLDSIADFTKNTDLSKSLPKIMPVNTTNARNLLRTAMKLVDPVHFKFLFEQKYYPEMVLVQGGKFMMGCEETIDPNCKGDEILHKQDISSYSIARTETTVWQFALFYAAQSKNINDFLEKTWSDPGNNPIVNVSWYYAVSYANWVSKQKGAKVSITKEEDGKYAVDLRSGYRLPTEAEWEYAAKGGSRPDKTIYSGSNDLDLVTLRRNSRTYPVGMKKANSLGLYDMSGDAWEWCWDWYGAYKQSPEKDYLGLSDGLDRVIRGGNWNFVEERCRVADRYHNNPVNRYNYIGFRLVFVP